VQGFLTGDAQSTMDIATKIYTELPKQFLPIAAIQVECGLIWLEEEGLAQRIEDYWIRR
jgi:hypothetical protein